MRRIVLTLLALLLLSCWAAPALAARVYLKDGGWVEAKKVWRADGRVLALVNRDTLAEFAGDEVDLRKTFAVARKKAASPKSAAQAVETPAKPAEAAAMKPLVPPAPVQAKPAEAGRQAAQVAGKPAAEPAALQQQPPRQEPPQVQQPQPQVQPLPRPVVVPPPPSEPPGEFPLLPLVVVVGILLLLVASFWRVFEKAGVAGWKSLVPIYNIYLLTVIAGKPGWWFLLLFVPLVGVIIQLLISISLAERFGKGALYGLGLFFFGFITFPLLAFGDAEYQA